MAKWTVTTESKFDEMLGVLPPAYMGNGGFLVGEPMDHFSETGRPRFSAFIKVDGTYYESVEPLTVAEFKAVDRYALDIVESNNA